MIFIVILIRKLRECDSSSGSSASEGGGVVINGQVGIQLPTLNTDDGSVRASAAWYLLPIPRPEEGYVDAKVDFHFVGC